MNVTSRPTVSVLQQPSPNGATILGPSDSSNLQGSENYGAVPLQSSGLGGPGYGVNLQKQRHYSQQQTQPGVTYFNLHNLANLQQLLSLTHSMPQYQGQNYQKASPMNAFGQLLGGN